MRRQLHLGDVMGVKRLELLVVAVHVAFERHILKPGYHLIGNHLETRRSQAMAQLNSTRRPHLVRTAELEVQRGGGAQVVHLDVAAQVECQR